MATPHICPECRTPQTGHSPFCEHCGYRLRAQETAVEGVAAITPAQLAAQSRRISTQEEPTLTREQVKAHAAGAPSRTYLEGLPAVTPPSQDGIQTSPAPSETAPRPAVAPAEVSALMPMAPPPKSALTWLAPLVGGVMLGGILGTAFTWFAMPNSSLGSAMDDPDVEAQPDAKLAFNASSFTRGLDEATRARILRLCYKLSDDAGKECKQETLLEDEYPQKKVDVAAFKLDVNEVSNARYDRCVAAGACEAPNLDACQVYTVQGLQIALRVPKILQEPDHPVVCITHAQAKSFCAWSKGRLATHDEWEFAARGSQDARLFPWGDFWNPEHANWGERDVTRTATPGKLDRFSWTAPLGAYPSGFSPFDAHDMSGNVSEWVDEEATTSPQARGGGWTSSPYELRVTKRVTLSANVARTDVGTRCAYD